MQANALPPVLSESRANASPPPLSAKRKGKERAAEIDAETAKMQRLSTLAAAFRQCPNPSSAQRYKIARKTFLPPDDVEEWFEKRRVLETW